MDLVLVTDPVNVAFCKSDWLAQTVALPFLNFKPFLKASGVNILTTICADKSSPLSNVCVPLGENTVSFVTTVKSSLVGQGSMGSAGQLTLLSFAGAKVPSEHNSSSSTGVIIIIAFSVGF